MGTEQDKMKAATRLDKTKQRPSETGPRVQFTAHLFANTFPAKLNITAASARGRNKGEGARGGERRATGLLCGVSLLLIIYKCMHTWMLLVNE